MLLLFLAITALLLLIALFRYLCCRPKVKTEKKPLRQKHYEVEVEVEAERPHVETRVEHGNVKEWRDEPRVTEHRGNVSYGPRVHVETRTYSPNRDVHRERHGDQDWARWSHANWQGHD